MNMVQFKCFEISIVAHAMALSIPAGVGTLWDLYDTGASHHMSPAANKELFKAHGIGDMVITIPSVGFNLISIGRIDDAGYHANFGSGRCVITNTKGSYKTFTYAWDMPHCQ